MNKIHLYNLLQSGFKKKQAARISEGGDWRGGNSGCITEGGDIIGTSPRTTVLRHLGIEMATDLDDELIFDAGFKNEDHWCELLELAGADFKCEEDIPIKWALPNGETITGRPDVVVGSIGQSGFDPHYGIELKLVSSNGKMVRHSHFASANPSPTHVCQAAHYSSVLGVDWVLAYTSRAHFAPFFLSAKEFQFEHRSVRYTEKGDKIVNVSPFISMYDMTWQDDKLYLDGKPTVITAQGIRDYYQYCSDCVANREVPEHGGDLDIWGNKEKKNTNIMYDDFAEASTETFDDWVHDCQELTK